MSYCNCPGCKVVRDMQATIDFDELTAHVPTGNEYKDIFENLVNEHFKEDKDEANQAVKSKVS